MLVERFGASLSRTGSDVSDDAGYGSDFKEKPDRDPIKEKTKKQQVFLKAA